MPKVVIGLVIFAISLFFNSPVDADSHIMINEFASNVDTGLKEWVEFYNSASTDQSLAGWFLEERTGSDLSGTSSYLLDEITVPAFGFAIYEFSGSKLNNSGDVLTLKNGSTKIDEIAYGSAPDSKLNAPGKSQSAGRKTDGSSNWVVFDSFTKSASNDSGQEVMEPTPSPNSSPTSSSSSKSTTSKSLSPSPSKMPTKSPSPLTKSSPAILAEKSEELLSQSPSPLTSPSPEGENSNSKLKIAGLLSGSGIFIIALSIGFYLWYRKNLGISKEIQKDDETEKSTDN